MARARAGAKGRGSSRALLKPGFGEFRNQFRDGGLVIGNQSVIGDGENGGHTITYHNVVGDLRAVGVFKGQPLTLTLPRSAMAGLPHDGVAIVVQQGGYGHVLGASYLSRPAYYPAH